MILVACGEAQLEIKADASSDVPPESGMSDVTTQTESSSSDRDASPPILGGSDAQADGAARFASVIKLFGKRPVPTGQSPADPRGQHDDSLPHRARRRHGWMQRPGLSPAAPSDVATLEALLKAHGDASLPSRPTCEVIKSQPTARTIRRPDVLTSRIVSSRMPVAPARKLSARPQGLMAASVRSMTWAGSQPYTEAWIVCP